MEEHLNERAELAQVCRALDLHDIKYHYISETTVELLYPIQINDIHAPHHLLSYIIAEDDRILVVSHHYFNLVNMKQDGDYGIMIFADYTSFSNLFSLPNVFRRG